MKKYYVEPYAKEHNLLQLALFYFGKGKPNNIITEWKDSSGNYKLECNCKYGVPGSFCQDVYSATMRIWIQEGMPKSIKLNYSDIAKVLKLNPKHYAGQIKEALKKLAQARYEFTQCFIQVDKDGNTRIDTHFSLYDSASLFSFDKKGGKAKSKRNSESELIFPEKIQQNLEAKYYQLLDMAWYRALPEGLPRRLYEFLDKKHYRNINGVFTISEEAICRWLPINDKHTTNRRKRLKKIAQALIDKGYLKDYEFNKKRKLCLYTYAKTTPPQNNIAIKQIKEVTSSDNQTRKAENIQLLYLNVMDWLNAIPYFRKEQRREIALFPMTKLIQLYPDIRAEYNKKEKAGKRPRPSWVYAQFTGKAPKKIKKPKQQQLDLFEKDSIQELFELTPLKNKSKSITNLIKRYYQQHDFDYVKRNIEYVKTQKYTSFSKYLNIALKNDYGKEEVEETKKTIVNIREQFLALSDQEQQQVISKAKSGKYRIVLEISKEGENDWWNAVLNQFRELRNSNLLQF